MRTFFLLLTASACLLFTACRESSDTKLEKVSVFQGGGQCALPGEKFAKPLYILLSGASDGSFFSDPENPPPASGQKVRFEILPGSDLNVNPAEAVSDDGGLIKVEVTAGKRTGDQYLKVVPVNAPEKALTVRFVSGIRIAGGSQEGNAGKVLERPLSIAVVSPDGTPAPGVPVYFNLIPSSASAGAKIARQTVVTNENGVAETEFKLGHDTGKYDINVEVGATKNNAGIRGLIVSELGVNFYTLLMNVFGGLAIFVFGMKLMSDGLHKAAGDRMRSILHFFSNNRVVAVLSGAFVTAVIQSSSATTVMVIGFVNAGLLNLVQSIGIIFGANIGTTITAQIIAFDVSSIIMPSIIVGLLLVFVTWKYLRGWGETILGFGLLFFGMAIMSTELKLIGNFPSFIAFFSSFDCAPVNGWMPFGALLGAVGIGLIVTMIIQSSSAATGIILALGASGLINLYTAVALVLGSNIGTTITAQLAAIPANRVAKQAALAHTLFNVIGVLVIGGSFYIRWNGTDVPIFFYLVNEITKGDAFAAIPQNLPRHIANAHTIFNVITALLLLPCIGIMAKVCEWMLPVRKDTLKYESLEPHLLDTPTIALEQSVTFLRRMLKKSWKMVSTATTEHFIPCDIDEEKFKELERKEKKIDRYQLELTDYLVQITRRELSESQSQIIPLLMHCTNDAERIADHTENILQLTLRMHHSGNKLSGKALEEFATLYDILKDQAKCVISTLDAHNPDLVAQAMKDEGEIKMLATEFENHHLERLRNGECNPVSGVIYIEMLGEVEKISANLTNIAERSAGIQKNYLIFSKGKNKEIAEETAKV